MWTLLRTDLERAKGPLIWSLTIIGLNRKVKGDKTDEIFNNSSFLNGKVISWRWFWIALAKWGMKQ